VQQIGRRGATINIPEAIIQLGVTVVFNVSQLTGGKTGKPSIPNAKKIVFGERKKTNHHVWSCQGKLQHNLPIEDNQNKRIESMSNNFLPIYTAQISITSSHEHLYRIRKTSICETFKNIISCSKCQRLFSKFPI
jgi:hypothetical protein